MLLPTKPKGTHLCHVRTQQEDTFYKTENCHICWSLELGLSSFQNCEKYMSIVCKLPRLKYFITEVWKTKMIFSHMYSSEFQSNNRKNLTPVTHFSATYRELFLLSFHLDRLWQMLTLSHPCSCPCLLCTHSPKEDLSSQLWAWLLGKCHQSSVSSLVDYSTEPGGKVPGSLSLTSFKNRMCPPEFKPWTKSEVACMHDQLCLPSVMLCAPLQVCSAPVVTQL